MVDPSVLSFVRASLPAPPCRVLEVGAGKGELAAALTSAGYEVVAIDPKGEGPNVRPVALEMLDAPPASFDAAVAVLSMHHVAPLDESCRRLADVVKPGGALVLDEIDFARFDKRAAAWWLDHHGPTEHAGSSPEEVVAYLRAHCHELSTLQAALEAWFALARPTRGPYLYRWDLPPELRGEELQLIAAEALPETGARIVGVRR